MRLIVLVEHHTLLAVRLRPTSGSHLRLISVSLALLLGDICQSLVVSLDKCTSVAVDVVALVLSEAHLLAGGALFNHLLLHR